MADPGYVMREVEPHLRVELPRRLNSRRLPTEVGGVADRLKPPGGLVQSGLRWHGVKAEMEVGYWAASQLFPDRGLVALRRQDPDLMITGCLDGPVPADVELRTHVWPAAERGDEYLHVRAASLTQRV